MAAITDEVTISGGVFQSKAIAQLTADILGVTCYLSPANEPIFGLYDLYFGHRFGSKRPPADHYAESKTSAAYASLAEHYFD